MSTKKEYSIGDDAWIHGIDRRNNRLVKGKIIHQVEIPNFSGIHYIVAVSSPIEPILELRTWESISQDEFGPIGLFRDTDRESMIAVKKFVTKVGFEYADDDDEFDEPTAEQIAAAIEKSTKLAEHPPLNLKENKPKRRFYSRKKKS